MKRAGWAVAALIIFATACKKNVGGLSVSPLQDAEQHFNRDIGAGRAPAAGAVSRKAIQRSPDWQAAEVRQMSFGRAVIVPLNLQGDNIVSTGLSPGRDYNLAALTRLLVYVAPDGRYQYEVVTALPDSAWMPGANFSGIELVEDWYGTLLHEYKFEGSGKVRAFQPSRHPDDKISAGVQSIEVCYSIEGYNYTISDPEDGVYWSEGLGCDEYFFDDAGGSGGGLPSAGDYSGIGGISGGSAIAKMMIVNRGSKPIKDPDGYIKCFANVPGAVYTVSLDVDQPAPGQRKPYSSGSLSAEDAPAGLSVGHVFLAFTENRGGVIDRVAMGLYPSGPVSPLSPLSPGSLNDDSGHPYDVNLTITVPGATFMDILRACAGGNSVKYNLNSNNCATWALSSLAAGGIFITTRQGYWPFGHGDDPGDLGEDIRLMQLSPGMTRSVDAGYCPPNISSCGTAVNGENNF